MEGFAREGRKRFFWRCLRNRSGGTGSRTWDTMIFSHVRYIAGGFLKFQNPLF